MQCFVLLLFNILNYLVLKHHPGRPVLLHPPYYYYYSSLVGVCAHAQKQCGGFLYNLTCGIQCTVCYFASVCHCNVMFKMCLLLGYRYEDV